MNAVPTYLAKQLKWVPTNLLLRNALEWGPMREWLPGYTVVMACMKDLAPIAVTMLRLCARQHTDRMHEMILVFDCPIDEIPAGVLEAVQEVAPTMRIRLLGYHPRECGLARRISGGPVDVWYSWCLAIGVARTRAVIIQDLDAIPLNPQLFEQLYDNFLDSGADFCGIHPYLSHNVTPEMNLVTTFELTLDAAYVREFSRPIDHLNKIRLVDGRVVQFDTTLNVQRRCPRRAIRPIDESWLVHPAQLIGGYVNLVTGRKDFRRCNHSLLFLPYFFHLAGVEAMLEDAIPQLEQPDAPSIRLLDRTLYIDGLPPQHWAWTEKQIRRVEQAIHGGTRPRVEAYLRPFISRAGRFRTVGVETGAMAVADR